MKEVFNCLSVTSNLSYVGLCPLRTSVISIETRVFHLPAVSGPSLCGPSLFMPVDSMMEPHGGRCADSSLWHAPHSWPLILYKRECFPGQRFPCCLTAVQHKTPPGSVDTGITGTMKEQTGRPPWRTGLPLAGWATDESPYLSETKVMFSC